MCADVWKVEHKGRDVAVKVKKGSTSRNLGEMSGVGFLSGQKLSLAG